MLVFSFLNDIMVALGPSVSHSGFTPRGLKRLVLQYFSALYCQLERQWLQIQVQIQGFVRVGFRVASGFVIKYRYLLETTQVVGGKGQGNVR